ncbi:MAG: Rpn family recombination-promoting nuclease/putative transposase [Eubacterium sp.]|nr:Rpn family recombination-promoting nuclease/putative transposase [Eubacterium sp.]
MGQKDRTEKYLESYNDVFADIFNVLLFKKKIIKPDRLRALSVETVYKAANGYLGMQERDIIKEYRGSRFLVAALGIENQSTIDKDMPIRVMGYDYTAYQEQIKNSDKRVPVITIVLNFSKTKWTSPLSLKDILHMPEELAGYVQDYKIHVFNIAHLPREVRNQFTSDFKVVADYFSEKGNPDYQPGNEEIHHVEAVLSLLRVFTNDDRYDSIIRDVKDNKLGKERITMCTFVDRMVNIGVEQGIKVLVKTCQGLNVSKEKTKTQIADGFSISDEEAEKELEKYWS